jgi:nuclear RNA export factor
MKGGHMPDNTSEFVSKFLEQYYSLFDSNDRQPLLAAYHEQALFSYSVGASQEADKFKTRPIERILSQDNRNLFRIKDDTRMKTLKQGKVNVVAALCELPKSKHEPASFFIDVPLFNDCIIQIVVNGILRFFDSKSSTVVKSFCRHFTVVPHNGGFVVINDQLVVANASIQQMKKFGSYKPGQQASGTTLNEMDIQPTDSSLNTSGFGQPSGSANNSFNQTPSTSGFTAAGDPANAQREMILAQFCEITKMNRSFAHQCLSENDYDPNRSMEIFRDLSGRGLIPAEAFT